MRRTARNVLIPILLMLLPGLPAAARGAEESLEAIESDLASILKEMDAMAAELDRIEDLAAAPKATGVRVEIHRGGDLPAPVSCRILVGGDVEEKREWATIEREAFAGGSPLVFHVPLLPGTYAARLVIAHPSWKTMPAADFRASLSKGETLPVRFRLSVPPGKTDPALLPLSGK